MSVFLKRGAAGLYPPRIVCFVCASEGPADYPLFAEPPAHANAATAPHFPFLLGHPPPMGCLPVSQTGGEAKACRLCYIALMRQWEEYERARVQLTRRSYWIKRADEVPFQSAEQQNQLAERLLVRLGLPLHHPMPPAAAPAPAAAAAAVAVVSSAAGLMLPPVVEAKPASAAQNVPQAHAWSSSRESRRTATVSSVRSSDDPMPLVATSSSSAAAVAPPAAVVPAASAAEKPGGGGGGDNDSALDLSSGSSRERETKSRSSESASHISAVSGYQSEGAGSSTDILDLTLPDKNAAHEVCYVCGEEFKRGTLSHSLAKQMNREEPFYPSLLRHSRPPRSQPVDAAGRVQTCDDCHDHLLRQWHKFESDDVPHADRDYVLRKRPAPPPDNTTFVCYICALEYHSSSLRLLYARPNSEQEPYYPFIEQQRPPPGASPISPQGMVQVCTLCYKSTKEKHHGFPATDQPPPKKRRPINPSDFAVQSTEEEDKGPPADITCILCRRKFSVGSFKFLHSRGPPMGGIPFFPFLTELPRPDELADEVDDKQGKVRACQGCTTSLINQWTAFQREGTAMEERQYSYPSLSTGARSISSVRAQSPGSQRSGTTTPVKSATATSAAVAAALAAADVLPRARSNTIESRPRSASTPHSPTPNVAAAAAGAVIPPPIASPAPSAGAVSRGTSAAVIPPSNAPSVVANTLPPNCNSPGPTPSVHSAASAPAAAAAAATTATPADLAQDNSQSNATSTSKTATTATPQATAASSSSAATPSTASASTAKAPPQTNSSSFYCFLCGLHSELSFSRMLYSRPQGKKAPYFPFMKSHVPKNKAETLREDGSALVCTFCYHTVMVQWARYNESKGAQAIEPGFRKYNLNDYSCYVCGVTTYRKRIRALRVMDFPFIRHHKPRVKGITLENGEMVAVCLDCYDRLRGQFSDGERYGIPVEQRQYNWIKVPPPPEDAAAHITTPQERLLKVDKEEAKAAAAEKKTSSTTAVSTAAPTAATSAAPATSTPAS